MSKKDKKNEEKPAGNPAPKVQKIAADVARPYLEQAVSKYTKFFIDQRPIQAMLADLNPATRTLLGTVLPGGMSGLLHQVPDSAFGSPIKKEYILELSDEVARQFGESLKQNETLTPERSKQIVEDADAKVSGKKVVIDPFNHVHGFDCVNLHHIGDDKKQEISFQAAAEQDLLLSPCCHKRLAAKMKSGDLAAAPSSAHVRRSPMEIIGSLKDAALRTQLLDWIGGLPADDRKRVLVALKELDSENELRGMMAMDPIHRIEALPLLEERNAIHTLRHLVEHLGVDIEEGEHAAVAGYRHLNERLAPAVARQQARRAARTQRQRPWWKTFLPL